MKDATGHFPIAYSYVRFSHPDQAKGDSLRRQTQAAAEWCQQNGVHLDTSTTLRDLGKSAYLGEHRKNPDRHALAAFLKLVEAGKVPRGSYLIIENLDRLSREEERAALRLWMDILDAGVNIVQLKPETVFRHEKSDMFDIMRAVMELSRGHGESAIKSERLSQAWAEKKRRARERQCQKETKRMGSGCRVITRRLPAWVGLRDGKPVLIPERAAAVRRIFALAAAGYGQLVIVRRLIEEGVPAFGDSGRWVKSYVAAILSDRRAVGEFQPWNKRDDKPDGDPIPNYYPAAVTEDQWHAARAGAAQRVKQPGRIGEHVNVFAGLVRRAPVHSQKEDDSYFSLTRGGVGRRAHRVLINTESTVGRAEALAFPLETFERAVLSQLAEVDPREILGQSDGPDDVMVLSGELARIEAKIAELEAELLKGDVAALAKVLRQLEGRKRDLAEKLAEARREAANPIGEAWAECKSLLAALDAAPDQQDARLRLRSALRRVVEEIRLLIVPRGHARLAAVEVFFAGSERRRSYLILHQPTKSNGKARVEGRWWVRSLSAVADPGAFDLRKPGRAAKDLERVLAEAPLDLLSGDEVSRSQVSPDPG
jgi:DNA invertase Pin-like site-specific DNA recombinase